MIPGREGRMLHALSLMALFHLDRDHLLESAFLCAKMAMTVTEIKPAFLKTFAWRYCQGYVKVLRIEFNIWSKINRTNRLLDQHQKEDHILSKRTIHILCAILFGAILTGDASAQSFRVVQGQNATVYYDDSLQPAAKKVTKVFPQIYGDLVNIFGWEITARPSVLLLKERKYFLKMVESPLSVAFAVPQRNLIVIDYSRMLLGPFRLSVTLKHELCHLLLHQHIRFSSLPRWLDEGLCQWASDGIDEIIMDQQYSQLNRAALSNDFIPLNDLKNRFPRDERGLILAYQESKSFVTYLFSHFGRKKVLSMLDFLASGMEPKTALQKAFSTPFEDLEKDWHQSLRPRMAWLEQISYHLYEILFAFAALICAYAFVRILLRKRLYKSEEESINKGSFS